MQIFLKSDNGSSSSVDKWKKYICQTDKKRIIYKNDDYPLSTIETLVLVSTGETHYLAKISCKFSIRMFDTLSEAILYILMKGNN